MLPNCDKPYHKIKEKMPLGEELGNLWNYPLHLNEVGVDNTSTKLYGEGSRCHP